jgi:hypothetical protein
MRILLTIIILIMFGIVFRAGIQYGKYQIVKQALSKIPTGKIDMFDKDNWKEFRSKMIRGER